MYEFVELDEVLELVCFHCNRLDDYSMDEIEQGIAEAERCDNCELVSGLLGMPTIDIKMVVSAGGEKEPVGVRR